MANIHIKSDEFKNQEIEILNSFRRSTNVAENREMAECIVARTHEAYDAIKRMEG